ncbi:MAG TPA: ABC transporter substrate-binding protein [Methylomirabilota bacterium]|nr:ABC transporter substrate-binding protein [Methylomirabilota bacterium]
MIHRRDFVRTIAAAGAGGALGWRAGRVEAEPPPETPTIRVSGSIAICTAPQLVSEDLLRAEGFSVVQDKAERLGPLAEVAAGTVDIGITFIGPTIIQIDGGQPVTVLAGVHPGCFELFGTERVRSLKDLKGKKIAVIGLGSSPHVFLSSMLAHVGLDPRKDVEWVVKPRAESVQLFQEGKVDAYMGFPPEPQELRARRIGHVVVNSAADRPWSQYFCCMVAANREFVRKNPVATKRALRAFMKATDICAVDPERIARSLVDKKFTARQDYALATLRELPYGRWREYNPEDSVRFYALRLHEAGMVKASPQKIIAQGTDWRFLDELRRELKG